ncbi:MAG: GNAT family N-acetyltransferase [Dehalococcoidales bacterium]|jgi:ribonuclease HI/GNAT superfamily N-acetyltransferase
MIVKKLVIYTDGASRGNPGPAAIGVVIQDESGRATVTISQCLGEATNNQAEYRAIIAGLEKALELGATHVELRSDSELVVKQISNRYKVKNEALKPLFLRVEALRSRLFALTVSYIPREKNTRADRLANQALDGKRTQDLYGTPKINIRRATKTDYPALIEIIAELEKQHVDGVPQVFREESYEEKVHDLDSIFAEPRDVLLVTERDSAILGYIHLSIIEAEKLGMLKPRRYVKIRDLAVAGKYQKSGVGSALMQVAERWASERGIDTIELNVWEFNRGVFAFYQKLGYVTSSYHMWKHIQT